MGEFEISLSQASGRKCIWETVMEQSNDKHISVMYADDIRLDVPTSMQTSVGKLTM